LLSPQAARDPPPKGSYVQSAALKDLYVAAQRFRLHCGPARSGAAAFAIDCIAVAGCVSVAVGLESVAAGEGEGCECAAADCAFSSQMLR